MWKLSYSIHVHLSKALQTCFYTINHDYIFAKVLWYSLTLKLLFPSQFNQLKNKSQISDGVLWDQYLHLFKGEHLLQACFAFIYFLVLLLVFIKFCFVLFFQQERHELHYQEKHQEKLSKRKKFHISAEHVEPETVLKGWSPTEGVNCISLFPLKRSTARDLQALHLSWDRNLPPNLKPGISLPGLSSQAQLWLWGVQIPHRNNY